MSDKTTDQDRNEQLIRRLYYVAEAASKDRPQFVSLFADRGISTTNVHSGQRLFPI